MRRWSLDETPQLFNVLAGHMSLVGPRPLPQDLDGFAPSEQRRLLVKPGMTGLWQINGRSNLNWDETVRLDLYYVENWSLAADFVILLRTAAVVLRGEGAY
jgi:lipopolysaccharide/colanic/teichoic acid biosynthesis glycosyltransferase